MNSGFDESSIETHKMQLSSKLKAKANKLSNHSSCSEVSCDTVVFIGNNGKRSYLKSSQQEPQQQQGTPSDSRLNKPQPKLGVFSTYYNRNPRSSSSSGSTFSSSSSSMQSKNNIMQQSSKSKEIWIDGPKTQTNAKQHEQLRHLATKILTPSLNEIKLNEIWIDGPKSSALNHCDSLECLDRQLLRQLNEHDMDIKDTVNLKINSDSRPISLLSVNSSDTTSNSISVFSNSISAKNSQDLTSVSNNSSNISDGLSYRQKLEDLKQSYDQMIFKQSYKEMESLHKTLESFLSLDQTSKLKMMMKPIKSTTLTSANDLNKQFNGTHMNKIEKEKRLSRILSPTRFKPAPQIQTVIDINNEIGINENISSASSTSSASSSSSSVLFSSSPAVSPNQTATYSVPIISTTPATTTITSTPQKQMTSSPILVNILFTLFKKKLKLKITSP